MGNFSTRKVFLTPSFELDLKERDKIDNLLRLLDDSGVWDVVFGKLAKRTSRQGRIPYKPENMFATVIFGFAMGSGSLRELESCCQHDLRYIYIMEQERPSYASFCEFINAYILPNIDTVFSRITARIAQVVGVAGSTLFLDGTKQEALPNKYKFVFKPTRFHNKLDAKAAALFGAEGVGLKKADQEAFIKSKDMFDNAKTYAESKGIKTDALRSKKVKDMSREEKIYLSMLSYGNKSLEYEEKEKICGLGRNSFYKTDHDATAMCLKEDYYSGLGSNMHSGYNVQLLVSGGLIMSCYVSQSRTDYGDLIPALDKYISQYGKKPENVVADAGYGILKNYRYLSGKGITAYVKYQNWDGEVSGRRPPSYNINPDGTITCLNGKVGAKTDIANRKPRRKGLSFFRVSECEGCPFSAYCRRFMKEKEGKERIFEVDEEFEKFRIAARDRLLSPKGIEMRVNRSCQVEGTFGVIKWDMGYVRFRRVSLPKANLEFSLTSLGRNIRKYFRFLEGRTTFAYWTAPSGLLPEEIRKPSAKKLSKRAERSRKKQPNEKAKKSHKSPYKSKKEGADTSSKESGVS